MSGARFSWWSNKPGKYGGYRWVHFVDAMIDPQALVGDRHKVSSAKEYIDLLKKTFTAVAEEISEIPEFRYLSAYSLKGIEYCINFVLEELGIDCSPELLMLLTQRGDLPTFYRTGVEIGDNNLFLTCKSVDIKCFREQWQSEGQPDKPIDVIRFLVQCKYPKVYQMYRNILEDLLDDKVSAHIVDSYFKRIIMYGDYYSMSVAKEIIRSHDFKEKKEHRLIDTLRFVDGCQGVSKARKYIMEKNGDLFKFNRALHELSALGINPVTIPAEYRVKHIPNLLSTFYRLNGLEKSPGITLSKSVELGAGTDDAGGDDSEIEVPVPHIDFYDDDDEVYIID